MHKDPYKIVKELDSKKGKLKYYSLRRITKTRS